MKKGIYILPNSITLCGMFFGFYAIIWSMQGNFTRAAWAIILASIFDAMDGWVARFTNSTSKFGVELDSLSDSIAFGVAPAVLLYQWSLSPFRNIGWAVAFLFVACGAMRLARFNIQMGGTERKSFTGMPIPAAAWICATTVLCFTELGWEPTKNILILIQTFVVALLMVSTLRFHSLKEIDMKKRKPFWILVAVVVLFVLVLMHPEVMLYSVSILYMMIGLVENTYLYLRDRNKPSSQKV